MCHRTWGSVFICLPFGISVFTLHWCARQQKCQVWPVFKNIRGNQRALFTDPYPVFFLFFFRFFRFSFFLLRLFFLFSFFFFFFIFFLIFFFFLNLVPVWTFTATNFSPWQISKRWKLQSVEQQQTELEAKKKAKQEAKEMAKKQTGNRVNLL